jgi:hypothetical protein
MPNAPVGSGHRGQLQVRAGADEVGGDDVAEEERV